MLTENKADSVLWTRTEKNLNIVFYAAERDSLGCGSKLRRKFRELHELRTRHPSTFFIGCEYRWRTQSKQTFLL